MPSASISSRRPIERLADAEDQLDGFGGLDHADQAGQNAEHAAFGAGGHEARRWRLGIEAAIARALLGREDAGLAFEAEDRAVDVRLAGEHAGVVDQVAGGEVVGAVDDDVEVAEELERVFAVKGASRRFARLTYGIDRLELLGGGVELRAADVGGASG